MNLTKLAVVIVALTLITAGCLGGGGSATPTEEPTEEADPSGESESDDASLADDADGTGSPSQATATPMQESGSGDSASEVTPMESVELTDEMTNQELEQATKAAFSRQSSYTVQMNWTLPPRNPDNSDYVGSVYAQYDRTNGVSYVSNNYEPSGNGYIVDKEVYATPGRINRLSHNIIISGERDIPSYETPPYDNLEQPNPLEYITTFNTSVMVLPDFIDLSQATITYQRSGETTYNGQNVYRYTVSDYEYHANDVSGEVLVMENGAVVHTDLTFTFVLQNGEEKNVEYTMDVTNIGSTNVEEPGWVSEAVNGN